MLFYKVFLEVFPNFIRQGNLGPFDPIQCNMNRFGGADEAFVGIAIDFVSHRKGRGAEFFDADMYGQLIAHLQGSEVIRFAVDDNKDKGAFVEHVMEAQSIALYQVLKRVMDKAELARKVEDSCHIGVMHSDFIACGKHTLFIALYSIKINRELLIIN